ncbi:MAG: Hsp70 family protein [Caldilineaceae bacterium]|nr:Hsp70 family protein [Caldilineaceae bacterium]
MTSSYRYIIGIDLGTTNSALAYVDLAASGADGARAPVRFFEIPQLVAAGEVAPRSVLPSFLYLPGAYDLPAGATALPWDPVRDFAVGEFAREQGVRVPGRLVASAKSWLSHRGVDRTAPILPWGAKEDVARVSPVTAAARYLAHMREAWNAEIAGEDLDQLFERQLIILTVPASFDEVARELTLQAAAEAGFPQAILLEEPLAAFYAWLARHEDDWQTHLHDGQLVLICDIGGGTTDFTLVGVGEEDGRLQLQRLAVGDHLLLGGDNMDLALGRHVETKLMGAPGKLDPARWAQLVAQCRAAKETLLGDPTADAVDITVVGAGGGLIAGTRKATLTRADVADLILDGFFPQVDADAAPDTRRRAGLTELGLKLCPTCRTPPSPGTWPRSGAPSVPWRARRSAGPHPCPTSSSSTAARSRRRRCGSGWPGSWAIGLPAKRARVGSRKSCRTRGPSWPWPWARRTTAGCAWARACASAAARRAPTTSASAPRRTRTPLPRRKSRGCLRSVSCRAACRKASTPASPRRPSPRSPTSRSASRSTPRPCAPTTAWVTWSRWTRTRWPCCRRCARCCVSVVGPAPPACPCNWPCA